MSMDDKVGMLEAMEARRVLLREHEAWERFAVAALSVVICEEHKFLDSTVDRTCKLADAMMVEWKKRKPK
jgi:hypothetical protein